jgi:membrane protein DedA with SNARE-associated domain
LVALGKRKIANGLARIETCTTNNKMLTEASLKGLNIPLRNSKLVSLDLRTYLFFAAFAALFVTLNEILDFFELPFESLPGHLLSSGSIVSVGLVTSSLAAYGYVGVFALMVLESASLPVPSEVVLPFAGYLVFKGSMDFTAVVLVSTAAGVVGALADYYLALKLGRPLVERLFKWSGAKPEHLNRAEEWLSKRGSWSVLVARFIPGMRSAISLPAGALRMKLGHFVGMTLIGSFGWSLLLVYLGYSAGSLWQGALAQPSPVLIEALLFGIALASVSYILYYATKIGGGQSG